MAVGKLMMEELAEYEARHAFARQVLLPEEDRTKYIPQAKWGGGYRWFKSTNR